MPQENSYLEFIGEYILYERKLNQQIIIYDTDTDTLGGMEIEVFLSGISMIGEIRMYAGSSTPNGWLFCDGAAISREEYSELFGILGENFGNGDGSSTFNLPDFRGRSPIGVGQGSGLSERSLADSGGEEEHTLSVAELPSHTHRVAGSNEGSGTFTTNYGLDPIADGRNTEYVGGDEGHENMPPFLCIGFIIFTGKLEE